MVKLTSSYNSSERIEVITGLRFLAATLVFVSHTGINAEGILQGILKSGHIGVSIFFVISGFVLSKSYSYESNGFKTNITIFYVRRLNRIYPSYAAALLISSLIFINDFEYQHFFVSLLLIQSWLPSTDFYYALNTPDWSISNEIFFYFLFPFLFKTLRFLCVLFLGIIILQIFLYLLLNHNNWDQIYFGTNNFSHWLFYICPISRLCEFLAGMLVYRSWSKGVLLTAKHIPLAYIALVCTLLASIYVPQALRQSLFTIIIVIYFFYAHLTPSKYLNSIYGNPISKLLGEASYIFYLIHFPMLALFSRFIGSLTENLLLDIVIKFIVTYFLAIVFCVLIERKMTSLLNARLLK